MSERFVILTSGRERVAVSENATAHLNYYANQRFTIVGMVEENGGTFDICDPEGLQVDSMTHALRCIGVPIA